MGDEIIGWRQMRPIFAAGMQRVVYHVFEGLDPRCGAVSLLRENWIAVPLGGVSHSLDKEFVTCLKAWFRPHEEDGKQEANQHPNRHPRQHAAIASEQWVEDKVEWKYLDDGGKADTDAGDDVPAAQHRANAAGDREEEKRCHLPAAESVP